MRGSYLIPLSFATAFMALTSSFFLIQPQKAASQTTTVVTLTTTGVNSWPVPADWTASNTIEVYGGGGGGALGFDGSWMGGGGGGAYSRISNLALTPGASVSYSVGGGGAVNGGTGGDTWFSSTGTVLAKGGRGGSSSSSSTAGPGGQASAGVGTVRYSGGSGGMYNGWGGNSGGGGGGGAAGPNGNGGGGGLGYPGSGGGGGAGAGGYAGNGGASPAAGPGAAGSIYGGGGGSGGGNVGGTGGAGRQGIIVITYLAVPPTTVPDAPSALNATANSGGINLTWTAPVSDGGSPLTVYKIYRDTTSPAVTLLDSIAPATTYVDSTAVPNTTYYYRVKATNAVGDSSFSNEDSATRPCSTTAPASGNVSGWAWSDTIGWISLSSADDGTCTSQSYGLDIDESGTISGKIWSENVGWISADSADLSGCPASPCTARMDGSDMEGWMKVLSADDADAAWDGWISISGSNYGPTVTNGTLSGYMWGDVNLGWVSFSTGYSMATTTWVPCTPTYQCTAETTYDNLCTTQVVENTDCTGGLICGGGAVACVIPPAPTSNNSSGTFRAHPQLVAPGRTTNLTWDIRYATECTVTEDNPQISDSWSTTEGDVTTSPIRIQTKYTLTCEGAGGNLTQSVTVYQTPTWKEL